MKRFANTEGKLSWGRRAGGVITLCAAAAMALPAQTLTTLHTFDAEDADPFGLVQALNGDLYGVTSGGTANNPGIVYKITPSGKLTKLYRFCSQKECLDGEHPYAQLVQAANGDFCGTTTEGNACPPLCGTVFSLSLGLGPFVETLPASGRIGSVVRILGTDLTGATGVTFNGAAAAFKVVSSSEITANVPAGATTGTVQVVTPNGTLSSNVPFRVP